MDICRWKPSWYETENLVYIGIMETFVPPLEICVKVAFNHTANYYKITIQLRPASVSRFICLVGFFKSEIQNWKCFHQVQLDSINSEQLLQIFQKYFWECKSPNSSLFTTQPPTAMNEDSGDI